MSQPVWKRVFATDYSQLFVDETGVYSPELEIAQEIGEYVEKTDDDGDVRKVPVFEVFRVSLDLLKIVDGNLVSANYDATWPHPVASYKEWFADDLADVARSCDADVDELREAFCSDDPKVRARAYEDVGGHFGFHNFDGYPLRLDADELDVRWSDASPRFNGQRADGQRGAE